ncbi:hypothetical protein GPX89_33210 [Nocardia sp. ET3-3]|uniref:Cellulose biosynthesis cyclic di-GMP-binding regulatory protein BcsB n=1 Tax=Nocardia terrae TaxID=2675851 RepID=A0A7K1V623_9NOCA|nr:hypothetical protein [Nocardia terrae]MVU82085.1 hypothetical protein [Nocardia terrae]
MTSSSLAPRRWSGLLATTLALTLTAPPMIVAIAPAPLGLPTAAAAPADHPIPLQSLGLGRTLQFPGREHEVSLTLPLLPGLVPVALTGTVQLPPALAHGTLETRSDQRLLERIGVPTDPRAPIRISLAGARVEGNAVSVTLASSLLPEAGICPDDWTGQPFTLSDAAVVYFGEERQPTTVAEFLPPVLERLTMYLPSNPSGIESAAVLALSTAATARYANQPVAVDIRRLDSGATPPDHPPAFLERQVVIREGDPELRVTPGPDPVLMISGDKDSLPTQIRLITSDLARAAMAGSATALGVPVAPQLAPESTTLAALGQSRLSATAIGSVRIEFAIDMTRLGRPSKNVRIHLRGNHTPLPETLNGQVAVTVGDRQIAAWPVQLSGRFDEWVTIPAELLTRFTTVAVTLQPAGLTHGCGLEQPITLTIDPDGEVRGELAKPPVPGGLSAVPQALLPDVQVGLQTPGFADTVRAAQILVAVQRLTAVPLRPELVSFDTAVHSQQPAVLVAPNGEVPQSITLPLERSGDTLIVYGDDADLETRIDLRPPLQFGSLQATWTGKRTVVVGTSTQAPDHLDRLLNWLLADPDRSFRLSGPVLLQAGDREPEFFDPAAGIAAQVAAGKSDSPIPLGRRLALGGGVALIVGLLAAVVILLPRRRSR